MSSLPPKLNLPTVKTCPWRRRSAAGTAACGLVSELLGGEADRWASVSETTCAACCESFPPAPQRLNPVVAGLVCTAAAKIDSRNGDGVGGSEPEHVQRVLGAVAAVPVAHPPQLRLTPLRRASCRVGSPHSPRSRRMRLEEMIPPPEQRSGASVRRWSVGVTTAPRRESTLEPCLDSLRRAGWGQPRLFLDGTCRIPPAYHGLPVTWREHPVGACPAWYLALSEMVFQQPDCDAYMIVQDDVVFYEHENLREYLEGVLWPGERPGIVSLFYTCPDEEARWAWTAEQWYFGAQVLIFPPGAARLLLSDSDFVRSCLAASPGHHVPIPSALADWVQRAGLRIWYPNPSLAQHIGNSSTVWHDAGVSLGRRAPWFSGSLETPSFEEELADVFPEDDFPCPEEFREAYTARRDVGRQRMQQSRAVICGLCRDVRRYLPRLSRWVERLGERFRDYRVVLVENDSVDGTPEFLRDWQAENPRVEVLSRRLGIPRFPRARLTQRAEWMADCRNRYREHVIRHYPDWEYAVVVDTDLAGGWSDDGLAHTFGADDWDAVGSYGLQFHSLPGGDCRPFLHFDIWAFRPAVGTPAEKLVNHNHLHLNRGEPMLEVESSFGGLAVYRMECLHAADYGGDDCEHVVLHRRLSERGLGRLFLNPSQIVLYTPA